MQDDRAMQQAASIRHYDQQTKEAEHRLGFAIGFAQSGLQALALVNGGALVALFTFIGSANVVRFDFQCIWTAFAAFAAGLVCNMTAYLAAHLSQDQFYLTAQYSAWKVEDEMVGAGPRHDPRAPWRRGQNAQLAAIATAVLSLICFLVGTGFALAGVLARP